VLYGVPAPAQLPQRSPFFFLAPHLVLSGESMPCALSESLAPAVVV
jgi:hypothetical protein